MPDRSVASQTADERLRRALRGGQIVAWEWDLETGLLTWSGNAQEVLGWSSDRARDFDERVHPDDRERHQAALQRTFSEGVPYDVEIRFVRPDGNVIWICDKGELQEDVNNRRILSGVTIDITARKHAEADLRANQEQYKALALASASTVWRARPDGTLVSITKAEGDLSDAEVDQYNNLNWLNVVHPEDREGALARWRSIFGSDKSGENAFRSRKPDGEYRWKLSRAVPIKEQDGSVREWIGTFSDIHEQKAAELALQESAARYRLLAENTGDVIILTGIDKVRHYVSPACRDLLGYDPEELLGIPAGGMTHPDDRERIEAEFNILLAGYQKSTISVYRLRHRKGHWVPVEVRRSVLTDETGHPQGVISVLRDISERFALEERLRRSQRMEAIGQLTGGIAHDFNNLLTVVIGNTELLAADIIDPQHRALAEMALQAAEKGASLTQHLLAFGRRQTLQPERLNLDGVVRSLEPLLRRTISENIEIRTLYGDSGLAALTDRALLESAIVNLAVNARDAMPDGGVLTIVTGERTATPGEGNLPIGQSVVFVTITDTGTGMAPEVLERAFEPFFTTKEVGKGSGLGLSMVYGFAQQTGGHVTIQSAPGQGTSVTIMLPAITYSPDIQAVKFPDVLEGQERVLIVEDNSEVRTFVSAQLTSLGYIVVGASDAAEALEVLVREEKIDLLFTDVVLPHGMSGVELARRAREVKPDLRVLLTSGYSEEVFEHQGRPEPGTVLLRKPFKRRDLADAIRKVLDQVR